MAEQINTTFHAQIYTDQCLTGQIEKGLTCPPVNTCISLHEKLSIWSSICNVTQSLSESKGHSKVSNTASNAYNVKKLCRFTCTCMLMSCIDDRCYLPIHSLITDMVDSCGGSTQLIQALNRLGICSSLDTLSRVIQQQVKMRKQKGPEMELHPSAMMIVSADYIEHKNQ